MTKTKVAPFYLGHGVVVLVLLYDVNVNVNVNRKFLSWLKQPKLQQSPRERSTEI